MRYGILLLTLMSITISPITAAVVEQQVQPSPQRVLFVGASLTSRLPSLTKFSLTQVGQRIEAVGWMRGGTGLLTHIQLGLLDHIRENDYDAVVLTAPRMWPIRQGADEALRTAVEAVRASGAEPILYDRPVVQVSYEDRPEIIEPGRKAMLATIQELETAALPVDRAFSLALKELPFDALFVEDRVHFTQAGWYLTMCVMHAMLTGRNPSSLPAFVTRDDDFIFELDDKLATRLQQWAWTAANESMEQAKAAQRPAAKNILSPKNRRPRLALRSPNGKWAVFSSGATVPLIAEVSSIAAPLTSVDVLVNGKVVETLQQPPYRTEWTPSQDGVYELRLRATDKKGRHARTKPVEIVIGELPPEPSRTPPHLNRILWLETPVNSPITVPLTGARFEPAFANWTLMAGDQELAHCADTAMKLEWTPTRTGYHDVHALARTEEGTVCKSEQVRLLVFDPAKRTQNVFLEQPAQIPGSLELEKFDHGGTGVAWSGGTKAKGPRADSGIMLFPFEGREWIIWAKAGNKMTYTVNVAKAGIYRPVLDAANRGREQGAKRLHLSHKASGQRVSFAVTPTGSNTDWIAFATEALKLPAGQIELELYCEDGDINIDTIRFDRVQ